VTQGCRLDRFWSAVARHRFGCLDLWIGGAETGNLQASKVVWRQRTPKNQKSKAVARHRTPKASKVVSRQRTPKNQKSKAVARHRTPKNQKSKAVARQRTPKNQKSKAVARHRTPKSAGEKGAADRPVEEGLRCRRRGRCVASIGHSFYNVGFTIRCDHVG